MGGTDPSHFRRPLPQIKQDRGSLGGGAMEKLVSSLKSVEQQQQQQHRVQLRLPGS